MSTPLSKGSDRCGCCTAIVQNVGVPGREFQETVLDGSRCRYPAAVALIAELEAELVAGSSALRAVVKERDILEKAAK